MKALLDKYLIAIFGFIGATGALLFKYDLIPADSVDTINKAGENLAGVIVAFIGLVVGAITLHLLKRFTPQGKTESPDKGKTDSGNTPGGIIPLFLLMGTMAGLMGCLPSCATTFHSDGSASVTTDPDAAFGVIDRLVDFFRTEPIEPVQPVEPAPPITPEDSGK